MCVPRLVVVLVLTVLASSARAQIPTETPLPTFGDCGPVCALGQPCSVLVDGQQFNGTCSILCQCAFEGPATPTRTPTSTRTATPTPTDSPEPSSTPGSTVTATPSAPPEPTETSGPPTETPTEADTATPTRSPSRTPSPNPTFVACVGNCDGSPEVTVNELITGVNIALGTFPLSLCPAFDADDSGGVTVVELVRAVANALFGCGVAPPTVVRPTRTPTPTETASPTVTTTAAASPTLTPTATESPTQTPTVTETPQPTRTRTATGTITSTPSRTPSVTQTPLGVSSVCGGFVGPVPQLCSVQVIPNPVPLGGSFRIRYCLADLEGDVNDFCLGIQTSPEPPLLTCQRFTPRGTIINECTETAPIPFTNPAGSYTAHVEFRDRAGNRSETRLAPFQVGSPTS